MFIISLVHLKEPSEMTDIMQLTFQEKKKKTIWDFPGGTVVKNPPANAGDMGLSPGPGRFHMPRSN